MSTQESPKQLFMVMKLQKNITVTILGKEITQELTGCAGYVPCFETLEEAEKAAKDGKFQIVLINPG